MSDATLAPVAPGERVVTLDILRGFALCGVLIGNLVLYSGRFLGAVPPASTLDEIAGWFVAIFVASKAQTLLTFLFGFGFAVQLIRAEARGEPVLRLYVRRMLALLAIGLAHIGLVWWGDVTWTYAVAGLGMLAFLHASERTRLGWGLALIFGPTIVVMGNREVADALTGVFLAPGEGKAYQARMLAALQAPSREGLGYEHAVFALFWQVRIYGWYYCWTLGRFLLGYIAGQRRWFEANGAAHLPVFRRMLAWCGPTALVASVFEALLTLQVLAPHEYGRFAQMGSVALRQLGLLAMTLTYVAIVVLLVQRPRWRRVLAIMAPPGRMPLTTYVSQSVVCTFAFYGWGLGWSGEVGAAGCVAFALAVYAVQIALAHAWLRRFRFGPLEWVWRVAVYGRAR